MSVVDGAPNVANIIERVKGIILKPKEEWVKIDGETPTIQSLFTGYAMILAIIPSIAGLIGGFVPTCVLGVCVNASPLFVVVNAVVSYILALVGIYAQAYIINELAPQFGGQKDLVKAMQLTVYAWTAAWLAGIFAVFPPLGILGLVGLYSFYLLYLGVPVMMKSPADKALVYTIVSIVVTIVVMAVIYGVTGWIRNMAVPAPTIRVGMVQDALMFLT